MILLCSKSSFFQLVNTDFFFQGLKALYSPYTGIVEFGDVARHYGKQFRTLGGTFILNSEVVGLKDSSEGDGTTKRDTSSYPVTIVLKNGKVSSLCLVI